MTDFFFCRNASNVEDREPAADGRCWKSLAFAVESSAVRGVCITRVRNIICNACGSSFAAARQQTSRRRRADVHRCTAALSARLQQRPATPLRPATTPIKICSFALRMVHNSGACDAADHRPEHRRAAMRACACAEHRRGGAAPSEKFCVRDRSGRKFSSFCGHSQRLLKAATPTNSLELERMEGSSRRGSQRVHTNLRFYRKKFAFARF